MFIRRELEESIKKFGVKFRVIGIFGPRQSGKTTLAKEIFKDYKYVLLEDYDVQKLARNDPRGFLSELENENGVILDEVQNVPELVSYLQGVVDKQNRPGFWVLTGSQNFLLNQQITQSLAGRIAIFELLPLSIRELDSKNLKLDKVIFNGLYPEVHSADVSPTIFYKSYIKTYLERDVRQIKNVMDLKQFQLFLKLCAGRIGQLLNFSSLADEVGVSANTIKGWISILEQCYIIFLLRPHYKNFGKRLVKTPKLYFYDTGVACSLLEIESNSTLYTHYLRGNLFENLIIMEIVKSFSNKGATPNINFWRNQSGNEIDCIVEKDQKMIPIEIKSGKTINRSFFDGLDYWATLTETKPASGYLVYGGDENMELAMGKIVSWRNVWNIVK